MIHRIEFTVSDETWQRIEDARADMPRAAWIKHALDVFLTQHELDPYYAPERKVK